MKKWVNISRLNIIYILISTSLLLVGCKSVTDDDKKELGLIVEKGMVVSAREEASTIGVSIL